MIWSFFNATVIAECCAFLLSLVLLDRKTSHWRVLRWILLATICIEASAWLVALRNPLSGNVALYNLSMALNTGFNLWILNRTGIKPIGRNTFGWLLAIFMVFWTLNFLFGQGPNLYDYFSDIAGDILLVASIAHLFYRVLTSRDHIELHWDEVFWYANGVLFGSVGGVLLYIFGQTLQQYRQLTGTNIYDILNSVVNILLYGCVSFAMLCRYRNTRL